MSSANATQFQAKLLGDLLAVDPILFHKRRLGRRCCTIVPVMESESWLAPELIERAREGESSNHRQVIRPSSAAVAG